MEGLVLCTLPSLRLNPANSIMCGSSREHHIEKWIDAAIKSWPAFLSSID